MLLVDVYTATVKLFACQQANVKPLLYVCIYDYSYIRDLGYQEESVVFFFLQFPLDFAIPKLHTPTLH